MNKEHIGIDVSKGRLDAYAIEANEYMQFENNVVGIAACLAWIKRYHEVGSVVLEPSGGYEEALYNELLKADLKPWRVDAKIIRYFIKSEGIRAKTDRIDAKMLARYGKAKKKPYEAIRLSEAEMEVKCLAEKRKELVKMREMEQKRLQRQRGERYKVVTEEIIAFFNQKIKKLEKEIEDIVKKDSELRKKLECLRSVPGVGASSSIILIALLPELGCLGKKQQRALVGVAPHPKESGTYKGKSYISGGRQIVRNTLYMCALTGARCNRALKLFYEKLVAKGKPKKVALVACMRKLLDILNAILAKKQLWDLSFSHQFSPAIA